MAALIEQYYIVYRVKAIEQQPAFGIFQLLFRHTGGVFRRGYQFPLAVVIMAYAAGKLFHAGRNIWLMLTSY
jgi:hypothetical protein